MLRNTVTDTPALAHYFHSDIRTWKTLIAVYYIGLRLHYIKKIDKYMPHLCRSLLPFYKHFLQAVQKSEHLLQQKTNKIYTFLIKQQAPSIHLRIKHGHPYYLTNYSYTFSICTILTLHQKPVKLHTYLFSTQHLPQRGKHTDPNKLQFATYAEMTLESERHIL